MCPVGGRRDHAQQRLYRIAARRAPAQIATQGGVNGHRVADRVAQLQLLGDEAADVLRLQFLQIQRMAREFVHEQPLDDPQSDRTGAACQPTGIEHVCVVAAQLFGDWTRRCRQVRDHAALAKDGQQGHQSRMYFARTAHHRPPATTVRQVILKKLIDAALVEPVDRQPTQRHPVSEVRDSVQPSPARAGCVATALQPFDVGRHIRSQRTVEQPALQHRMQGRDLGHGKLLSGRGVAVLRQRRNYVQPRVRRRYRSGATPGHPQHRREPTVHNWELRIMAQRGPMPSGTDSESLAWPLRWHFSSPPS